MSEELYKYVINLSLELGKTEKELKQTQSDWEDERHELYLKLNTLQQNFDTLTTHINNLNLYKVVAQGAPVGGAERDAIDTKGPESNEEHDKDLRKEESGTGVLRDAERGEIEGGGVESKEDDGA